MKLPDFRGVLNNAIFVAKKHSPEILLGLGTAGVVAGAVLVGKGTLKVEGIIDETKETIDKIHAAHDGEIKLTTEYTEQDYRRDIAITYGKCAGKLLRVYAPAIIVETLSILSFFQSHKLMKRRYLELGAAFATVTAQFKNYRKRVVDELGEEKDRQFYNGTTTQKIKEKVIDPETGKTKTVTKEVEVPLDETPLDESIRVIFCKETSQEWCNDSEYCLCFLKNTMRFCNERLKANGRLTLNDVRDDLGLKRTKAGFRYGWKYEKDNPDGDNTIDFGIRELTVSSENSAEVNDIIKENPYSKVYSLEFNCDGDVWEDWDRELNR